MVLRRLATPEAPPREEQTILCVARQYPHKRVADLLKAFALLKPHLPKTRLVVIGDGPEHPRLQRLAADLDLGASALLFGALPNDIVATTTAAIPEVVPDGRAGTLVPPADVPALAKTLATLLARPALRNTYADKGRTYVQQYNWPIVAQIFLNVVTNHARNSSNYP